MKYTAIKYFTIFIIASSLAALMIFGCSTETGRNVRTTDRGVTDGSGRRTRSSSTSNLDCAMPSGGSACEGDEACEELCKDSDHLDLTGKAKDECFDWPRASVERLDEVFEILKDPDEDDLESLTEDDVNLLCAAVDAEEDFWVREIDNYSSGEAIDVLRWVITNDQVTALLNEELGEEEGTEHLKKLVSALNNTGTNMSDEDILLGLDKELDTDDDETVLAYAESEDNDKFIEMVHDLLVDNNEDDGLCNKSGNWPDGPGTTNTDHQKSACILGVYCKLIGTNSENVRKSIADIVDDPDVERLVTAIESEGGLNGSNADATEEEDGEEWTNHACSRLAAEYNDTGLTLGL